ncbi:MAG: hypothetical protein JNL11_13740 [Bdellovibrionaceae bacterium]|nr:hypothetical protein [Pseudobdellovibrionaceae bacterium]
MLNKNGEPDAMKVASPVRRGVHVPTIRKIGWPEPTLLLSAMLKSVSLGFIYENEQSYLPLVAMNFIIAIALLFTPRILRSLIGEGVQSTAASIGATAVSGVLTAVAPAAKLAQGAKLSQVIMPRAWSVPTQKSYSTTNKRS